MISGGGGDPLHTTGHTRPFFRYHFWLLVKSACKLITRPRINYLYYKVKILNAMRWESKESAYLLS